MIFLLIGNSSSSVRTPVGSQASPSAVKTENLPLENESDCEISHVEFLLGSFENPINIG